MSAVSFDQGKLDILQYITKLSEKIITLHASSLAILYQGAPPAQSAVA
jgi:hypothetical protein